jgi:hypothetical protein
MRSRVRCGLLVSLLLLPASCAAPPRAAAPPVADAPAVYRSVHIDTLTPAKADVFEGARREWVDALKRANTSDGRGLFVQVEPDRFYTIRPFATFGSFDTRGAEIEKSLKRVPKEASDRYDRGDAALAFPHASEIWKIDDELSYRPAEGALTEKAAACGAVIVDDVRPDPESSRRFDGALEEIHKALSRARYPLTRLVFNTVYGAGHVYTLVLAPSREAWSAAPDVEAAVASVLGAARARELVATAEGSVEKHETHAMVVRHDLTWP